MKRIGSKSTDFATALGDEYDGIPVPKNVNPVGCATSGSHGGHSEATTLAQIEAALLRLETGEFGLCIACGGRISLDRLDEDPSVTDCGNCGNSHRSAV